MNRTYKRVVVPPSDAIVDMTDEDLNALRADLVDAKQVIEQQIKIARESGNDNGDWLIRSSGALAHMDRGLRAIKQEQIRRGVRSPVGGAPDEVHAAFEALDVLRNGLKSYKTLFEQHERLIDAVKAFLDDDSDENFDALERLVGDDN